MGCVNVSSSSGRKKGERIKEETTEYIVEGGKKTKITKQVIETTQSDGSVVTRTIVQKSIEGGSSSSSKKNDSKGPSAKSNNKKSGKDSSSDSDDDDQIQFIQESLQVHNQFRSKHHAPGLKINGELNKIAQKYAEKLAKSNSFQHSNNKYKGNDLGENLFLCSGIKITGKDMTQTWYDEIKKYDFKKAVFSSGTGHFTQLVWIDSKEVGFGFAKAKDGTYYGVANYYPPGNFVGDFEGNVKK